MDILLDMTYVNYRIVEKTFSTLETYNNFKDL